MMKKILTPILTVILVLSPVAPVAAQEMSDTTPSEHVVIAALQTGQPGAAGNDFIELYNPTTLAIDVTGWKLQYRAASNTGTSGWATKRTVACVNAAAGVDCRVVMEAHTSLLFATYAIEDTQPQPLPTGFSDVGGQLRIVAGNEAVVDMLGYGSALEAEGGKSAIAPPSGQALLRRSQDGVIFDTNINADDFIVGCYEPLPVGEVMPMAPPTSAPCPEVVAGNEDDENGAVLPAETTDTESSVGINDATSALGTTAYAPLIITELFPDPASPMLDSTDEFIELHNPTTQPVSAKGYVLESGADFRYHFTIGDVIIAPGGHTAIMAADSRLSLTNSGTAVRLLDPTGKAIYEVSDYGQAKSGQAWAKGVSGWQWTATPTPGSANVFATTPALAAAAVAAVKKTTATKATASKTATPKVTKATNQTTKAASALPSKPANEQEGASVLNYALLVPIGLLTLGYVCYEYRNDIGRWWHKTRQALTHKKNPEPTPQTD